MPQPRAAHIIRVPDISDWPETWTKTTRGRSTEIARFAKVPPRERNTDSEARWPGSLEITEAMEP